MRKIPLNFPLYDSVYGESFPEEQYYIILFDRIASSHSTLEVYSDEIMQYFIKELGFVEDVRTDSMRSDSFREIGRIVNNRSLLISNDKRMFITTRVKQNKGNNLVSFDFLYDLSLGELTSQIDFNKINEFKKAPTKSNIQIVKSEMGHLDTEEYELVVPECDLELNYGKDFLKLHNTIVGRLNKMGDKGIVLFHGDPGTGKTTYIKMLLGLIKNKEVLFIPPSMAETLSDPSIITFLMDHKNSILLIEDAEKVVGSRDDKGSQVAVSNILNLTDGILGDCLNVQVIATFNMSRERIDTALLRKGRLIAEHKFDKLSKDDTNTLLKKLKKNVVSEEGLVLADIYNIDTESNRISTSSKKIGF